MMFKVDESTGLMLKLMRKKEPLRSDLWAYLDHSTAASDALVLRHPLLHVVGVKMEGAAWINHLVQTAEEAAKKALSEERWLDYVLLHEPPYRVAVFAKLAKHLSDSIYWKCLGDLYISTKSIWERKRQLTRLLASDRPHRQQLMSAYERRYLAGLPNRLTIFRGSQSRRVQGCSWTLDEKKALWFAKRLEKLESGIPKIATGKVKKSDVIAYFSRRKEKEIVIDESKVKIVSIKKLQKTKRDQ
jgi:hypothetical protein